MTTVSAEDTLRICIYGDNRGSNNVHRAVLQQAHDLDVLMFINTGNVLKYDYGYAGTPDAVLEDYRKTFAGPENPLTLWPSTPGPVVFAVVGGHDEQFFLDAETSAAADTTPDLRYPFEGRPDLGTQLYEAFQLESMRIRVQPLTQIGKPLPKSPYGDYLLIVGSGARQDVAVLALYRSDCWCFKPDQIDWIDSTLTALREKSPSLPLLMIGHDWTWYLPEIADDGSVDGVHNAVNRCEPEDDLEQKVRLSDIMNRVGVDVAVASDRHAYWAETEGPLLRINAAATICQSPSGRQVAADNVWLEYEQTKKELKLTVHPLEPPVGCGLRAEAAAYGTEFVKSRAASSVWQRANP